MYLCWHLRGERFQTDDFLSGGVTRARDSRTTPGPQGLWSGIAGRLLLPPIIGGDRKLARIHLSCGGHQRVCERRWFYGKNTVLSLAEPKVQLVQKLTLLFPFLWALLLFLSQPGKWQKEGGWAVESQAFVPRGAAGWFGQAGTEPRSPSAPPAASGSLSTPRSRRGGEQEEGPLCTALHWGWQRGGLGLPSYPGVSPLGSGEHGVLSEAVKLGFFWAFLTARS